MLERVSAGATLLSAQSLFGGGGIPMVVHDVTLKAPTPTVAADAVTVMFTLSGWSEVCSDSGMVTLRAGSVLVIPAGVKISGCPKLGTRMIVFYIASDYATDQVKRLSRTSPLVHHLQNAVCGDRRVSKMDLPLDAIEAITPQLLHLIEKPSGADGELSTLAATAAIFAAVDSSIGLSSVSSRRGNVMMPHVSPRREVVEAVAMMQAQIACPWRISDLARKLSLSSSQLTRLFRRDLGVSPAAFLWRLRAERMAEILITNGTGVAESSRAVGWPNATVGSRAFKRRYGVSPLHYAAYRPDRSESAISARESDE